MDERVMQLARQLLDSGLTKLSEREQRVILLIARRSQVARNVDKVLAERQTFGERLADRVAQLGGSWGFITIFTGMLLAWVVLNTVVLEQDKGCETNRCSDNAGAEVAGARNHALDCDGGLITHQSAEFSHDRSLSGFAPEGKSSNRDGGEQHRQQARIR